MDFFSPPPLIFFTEKRPRAAQCSGGTDVPFQRPDKMETFLLHCALQSHLRHRGGSGPPRTQQGFSPRLLPSLSVGRGSGRLQSPEPGWVMPRRWFAEQLPSSTPILLPTAPRAPQSRPLSLSAEVSASPPPPRHCGISHLPPPRSPLLTHWLEEVFQQEIINSKMKQTFNLGSNERLSRSQMISFFFFFKSFSLNKNKLLSQYWGEKKPPQPHTTICPSLLLSSASGAARGRGAGAKEGDGNSFCASLALTTSSSPNRGNQSIPTASCQRHLCLAGIV